MALNLAGLSTYTNETGFELMAAAVYQGQTSKYIKVVSGAGDSFAIPTIANTAAVQANGCSLSSTNTSTLGKVTMKLCDLAYVNDLCLKDLQDYYTSEYLPKTAYATDVLPFEDVFYGDIISNLSKKIDTILWEGDSGTGCNGILDLITDTAYSASVKTVTVYTSTTVANIIGYVDSIITSFGFDTIEKESTLWMSPSNYRKLLVAWRNANYFAGNLGEVKEGVFIPGSLNIYARPTAGITSDDYMVCAANDNLVLGTLNEADALNIKSNLNEYNDLFRIKAFWKQGAQIMFPSQVVYFVKK
jgi:hypothetical protein